MKITPPVHSGAAVEKAETSHHGRFLACLSSERLRSCLPSRRHADGPNHCAPAPAPSKAAPSPSCASTVAGSLGSAAASGFAEVSQDVLFLTSQLAEASQSERDSVLLSALEDENLRVWHLGKNDLGDHGAVVLTAALTASTKLELLGLGHNGISDVGAATVAEAMERTRAPIRVACFANNDIGDRGAAALASALPHCPGLRVLDLRSNRIGPEGARLLAEALQQPGCAVQKLQLGGNRVGDEGARALAAAWSVIPNLEELALEENGISDEGAIALSRVLDDGATLLLSGNHLTLRGKQAVRSAKNAVIRGGSCCTVGL